MIPLFDWPAQRPKCFKNCVTKNPELFQDTSDLAKDFDSPICLAYTTAKIVSIFKNVIPCSWQRYCFWQRSLWSLSKRKGKFFICHALLWSYFLYHVGHALLHFAMLLLTKSTPKTRILSSIIHSPRNTLRFRGHARRKRLYGDIRRVGQLNQFLSVKQQGAPRIHRYSSVSANFLLWIL